MAVNETARRQALEDLIAWAVDHDPVTLEVEREDAWRRSLVPPARPSTAPAPEAA